MKEVFESIELEILLFEAPDIVASSNCPGYTNSCDFELPIITNKS